MTDNKTEEYKKAEELTIEFLEAFKPVVEKFAKLVNDVARFIEERK